LVWLPGSGSGSAWITVLNSSLLFVFIAFFYRGAYSDALSHFHAAVDADPNNYMSYYKRATVYMALSRSRPALADLDKILELKPDFFKVFRSWVVFSYLS
jgi:tetratricopeptide (TPR) repeat protein